MTLMMVPSADIAGPVEPLLSVDRPAKNAGPLWVPATLLLLAAFILLMCVQGSLFVPSSDEGLNLEGAERLLDGQRPYVDFFGHASPGAYLYQALVFHLAGRSIWTARALVLAYQSAQIALLFWIVAHFASRRAAWCAVWIYSAIAISDPVQMTAHHRWDSATLAFLSIAMALSGKSRAFASREKRWLWWSITGLVAVAAVIATPTIGLILLSTAVWLWFSGQRRALWAYLVGAGLGALALLTWMAGNGLLTSGRYGGYLGFLAFMKANYAEANRTSFGFVPGGWLGLFEGAGAAELLVRVPIAICLALPVLAPVLALIAWGGWASRGTDSPGWKGTAWFLAACQLSMLIYPFPRADLSHLAYTSAFACALASIWISRKLPRQASASVALFLIFWSLPFLYQRFALERGAERLATPIGPVLVCTAHRADLRTLLENVHKGDTMFAYPFMPTLGFLTQARNPTSFLFIQPGMMKDREEQALFDDLERAKPRWILWFPSTREQFLRVFPNATRLAYHYPRIEEWIEANYTMRARLPSLTYNLWELRADGATLH